MTILFLIVCLFAAWPASSQTKVYTNADLGRPLSPNRGTVTPEQLAWLVAHQFRLPTPYDGPTVIGSGLSPTGGPFSEYQNIIPPRRLDGSLWTDPPWNWQPYLTPWPYAGAYVPQYPLWPDGHRGGSSRPATAERRRSAFRPGRR